MLARSDPETRAELLGMAQDDVSDSGTCIKAARRLAGEGTLAPEDAGGTVPDRQPKETKTQ